VWATSVDLHMGYAMAYFPVASAVAAGLVAMIVGRAMPGIRGAWVSQAADALSIGFAAVIIYSATLLIGRDPAAVVLEVLAVCGLGYTLYIRRDEGKPIDFSTAAFIVALGLVVQANLMRLVGPPGDQSILGILDLRFPAVTSLLWATAGSALTIWSRKVTSRALWVSGAVLLVASAVKLVLFDFGSLGQLANILAVIAAGGMFLLVGWLAPMPPAPSDRDTPTTGAPPSGPAAEPNGSGSSQRTVSSPEPQPVASTTRAATDQSQRVASAPRAAARQSHAADFTTQGSAPPSEAAPAATDPTHERNPAHAQHGLYEYAQAQQRRMSPDDARSSRAGRSLRDEEIDASNRRTAWTISIVVVLFLLIAAQGHNVRALFRLFGWHLY
jgi:hypothetical protein